ncbi:hypothetical protein LOC68_17670 [Blastopirellula sp. JC732]|uniref:DJ-1/PfpI domain-containing protein n=1 Tax=Blastopirellula sediminis TaxID=2894196 RepID=A0A9X1MPA5_9BACT|nr:hypothetical protein [Blastopirellula sediminis]MCC9606476.1 hypothetical protein [Blastopirellula sediminis]MCC9630226.1 hypothetical protein [Blastopirellula sediminis]
MSTFSHFSSLQSRKRKPRRTPHQRARLESLESRQLMAADLDDLAGLSDEFDDSSTIADWSRLYQTENWNADQLNLWDIDQTQPGRMVMQPHTVVWYQNWRGPMTYKEVTGDFVFTTEVHITDRDDIGGSDADDVPGDGQFSLGGVMIRTPRDIVDPTTDWQLGSMMDDGTNNGENYVFLSMGYGNGGNNFSLEVKTTRNSDSQLELTPIDSNTVQLQIARIGNSIITLIRLPGEDWQVHRRYTRDDMPETLQVGLVTYTNWEKASDFDPFTHNSSVLVPGQVVDPTPGEAFDPDLTAGFEFARYARPQVPTELEGVDLVNTATTEQLLAFLGDNAYATTVPTPEDPVDLSAVLDAIQDQMLSASQGSLVVALPAALADGTPLAYSATVVGSQEYELDQQYDFYAEASYYQNWGGHDERWIHGNGTDWFFLLPTGQLFAWSGTFESSVEVAQLDSGVYDDPTLLFDVPPTANVSVSGNELTFIPVAGFLGDIELNIEIHLGSVADPIAATKPIVVTVANSAPVVVPIADQSMSRLVDEIFVPLSATDADGDPIVWNVTVVESLAYQIDQQYQLPLTTNYHDNWAGQNERWLQGAGGVWLYLLPDGSLHQWDGSFATSPLLAQFAPSFYNDPSLLTEAEALPVALSIVGDQLVINPADDYFGTFEVIVTATDGLEPVITQFAVEVTNTELSLPTIGDLQIDADSLFEMEISAVSPLPAEQLIYSAQLVGSPAEQLDQQYDLQVAADFHTNWGGQQEKWLQAADGSWFYFLPGGDFYRWNGSFAASEFLASFDTSYYDNPNLLADPQSLPVSVMMTGSTLSIEPGAGYLGTLEIEVSVFDGANTATQIVSVEVAEPQATLEPLPVLIVIANQDFYYQEYADTRASLEAAGISVVVAAATLDTATPHTGSGEGPDGGHVQPDVTLFDVSAVDYSTIVFVGGWGSSQYQYAYEGTYDNGAYNGSVALHEATNNLINDFVAQDKYVTAICHGVSVLAYARVDGASPIAGHTVSAWGETAPSAGGVTVTTRSQIEANGATMVNSASVGDPTTATDDVVVDGRIITAENYDSAALFGSVIADLISEEEYVEHIDEVLANWP